MGKWDRILARLSNNPIGVSFDDLEALLQHFDFAERAPSGGSHYVFSHRCLPGRHLTIPRHDPVKPPYVRQAIELIDRLLEMEDI